MIDTTILLDDVVMASPTENSGLAHITKRGFNTAETHDADYFHEGNVKNQALDQEKFVTSHSTFKGNALPSPFSIGESNTFFLLDDDIINIMFAEDKGLGVPQGHGYRTYPSSLMIDQVSDFFITGKILPFNVSDANYSSVTSKTQVAWRQYWG